jgi:RHS repeat-associated protein
MVLVVNHVPGFSYDANGDVTNDGANTYAYNVEGRPMTVSGYGQIFDAFDRLVESQNAGGYTSIVYSPDGYKLALMNGSSVVKYMAPLAAGLQAVYTANTPAGVAYWRHADWLGSSRLASTVGQTVNYDQAYAPFGESYAALGTPIYNFTGQTKDTSPANYDFLFRQYSPGQGRWLVPDPAGLAAVDITNPQTWNRYAYLANNPLNAIDPKGLYNCQDFPDDPGCNGGDSWGGGGWGGGGGGGDISDPSGSDNTDTPNLDNAANEIEHFFGGEFSGTWNQQTMNSFEAQRFWQSTGLLGDLTQNQNPKAQAAIAESQYQAGLPPLIQHGYDSSGTPIDIPIPVSAAPWPQHTFATSARAVANFQSCLTEYSENFQTCIGSYSGPELQACVQRAMGEANNCNSILKF